jgi:uncharacterized zinc-type alcohol dehydrogenase-like protein
LPAAELQMTQTLPARGFAAESPTTPLAPFSFVRRVPGPRDVQIEILFCGVCHSDLHQARDEWAGSVFPIVPGHEILGRVAAVGGEVTRFKQGDTAAVGCMVDSCRTCAECCEGLEQLCQNTITFTYNSPDPVLGGMTFGGYSDSVVVDQDFVLRAADTLDPAGAAPLLCAGITTWSPLRHWKVGPGQRVGVVGLGGLGHMAVKFAHAFGAEVALFTTTAGKAADAKRLGADEVILTKDPKELARHQNRFDFLLDTVAAPHDLDCAAKGIVSDVEVIPMQQINAAYERMLRSDVKYRFVIDLASLKG